MFDHRVQTSPLSFALCRDCLPYSASAKTIHDLLLPAETTIQDKWLPAETVCVILLPAETLGRKQNHTVSIYPAQQSRQEARDPGQSWWKPNMTDSLCRKRKLADSFIPYVDIAINNLQVNYYELMRLQTYKQNQLLWSSLCFPGPEVIKLFSCSTQLSMKFFLLIKC